MKPSLSVIALCLSTLGGCSMSKTSQQKSPLTAPSGRYTLKVELQRGRGGDPPAWYPEILDAKGDRIYRDGVGFPETDRLAWAWDEQDRVWIFSAESESVDVIERRADMGDNFWRRVWTGSHPCASSGEPCPPLSIYPDPLRERIEEKGR